MGCLAKDRVLAAMQHSLEQLHVTRVETYVLHSPDPATPVEETLSAIQELYMAGKFKRFWPFRFQWERAGKGVCRVQRTRLDPSHSL